MIGYKIYDRNGFEMPSHWSGRDHAAEEAERLRERLNKNGEHGPYTIKMSKESEAEIMSEAHAQGKISTAELLEWNMGVPMEVILKGK